MQFHLIVEKSAGWQPALDNNEYPLPEQQPAAVEAASAEVEVSEETTDTTGNKYLYCFHLLFSAECTIVIVMWAVVR